MVHDQSILEFPAGGQVLKPGHVLGCHEGTASHKARYRSVTRKRWLVFRGGILIALIVALASTGCSAEDEGNAAGLPHDEIIFDTASKDSVGWSDMPFADLKEKALVVTYESLYKDFERYSLKSWMDRGGPIDSIPPLLYFEGELVKTTD